MKKKILFGVVVALGAVVALPMFSAFEAHVINVTAQIENALAVTTKHIDFGTVFPQEHLEQPLDILLSRSFMAEDRVDDVEYIIRQKPKCGVTTLDGTQLVAGSTQTGHVMVGDNPATPGVVEAYWIDCGKDPNNDDNPNNNYDTATHMYGVLPSLCEYISKEGEDKNDGTLPSFHQPWWVDATGLHWNDVRGRLAKSGDDIKDTWTIDLSVPCFGGYCAQDWDDFVHEINPNADPDLYTQPIENEHKIFGCDLWVEVTGVSATTTGTLMVIKEVMNNDEETPGTKVPGDFTIDVTATNPSNDMFAGEGVPGTPVTVDPGAYSVHIA